MGTPLKDHLTRAMVAVLRRLDTLSRWLSLGAGRSSGPGGQAWPAAPGTYVIGERDGCVAVYTLTSRQLVRPLAALPDVVIAGRGYYEQDQPLRSALQPEA